RLPNGGGRGDGAIAVVRASIEHYAVRRKQPAEMVHLPLVLGAHPKKPCMSIVGRIQRPPKPPPLDAKLTIRGFNRKPMAETIVNPPFAWMVRKPRSVEDEGPGC